MNVSNRPALNSDSDEKEEEEEKEGEEKEGEEEGGRKKRTASLRQRHYDHEAKAITQSLEGQMSSVTEKSAKYAQIAAEEVPKSLYCLGVRLTFRTLSYRGSYAVASKLTHNSLYHFCVFSDNIVDTSVVVNSTALNSKVSDYHHEKFRFTAEFIEMRRAALDIFVNWIALHPELQHSEDLRTFLQADEETMERFRFRETGIFKAKPADLMQMFRDVQSKVSDAVRGKEKPVEETTPEYEKLKHYVFELENHLAEAQKHAYRLVKRHRELGQSLLDFGKAVKLLRACEGEPTGKAFSDLGTKSELLSIKLQKVRLDLYLSFFFWREVFKLFELLVNGLPARAEITYAANSGRASCVMLNKGKHIVEVVSTLFELLVNGLPARAEITYAANSGRASCVMLNKGKHIVEVVSTLDTILQYQAYL
ncbi:hypothetical protein DY000_02023728 [Brassica cretica]|uniref:PX domain-containing protein n=1 Tax=Brassica cretica TaxID=69181 RepID=A0ABQ7ELT4_BRACR|nr:hypothetical protein DY000_02023728 [Brassica cretica]